MRLKVPIENILGSAYYHYEITSTDYNPNIDSTITISVSVKSVFGNPIKDKSVTLYQNGSSVGSADTNNNGIATFTYQFTDWDNHIFTSNGATLDLQAKGWKTLESATNYTILANKDTVRIDFKQGSNATVPTTYSYNLPNGYYPFTFVGAVSGTVGDDGVHYAIFRADPNGNLRVTLHRNTYNTGVNTIYGELTYPYK